MAYMEWDDAYALGENGIDRQHRRLVDLVNEVHGIVQDPARAGEIMHSLTSMFLYAREHFFDEEALMERLDYPGRAAHAREHQEFVKGAQELADAYLDDRVLPGELLDFLVDWFCRHVRGEDARLGEYLRGRAA